MEERFSARQYNAIMQLVAEFKTLIEKSVLTMPEDVKYVDVVAQTGLKITDWHQTLLHREIERAELEEERWRKPIPIDGPAMHQPC